MSYYWTIKEMHFLLENYPSKGAKFVAEKTGRSIIAVRGKASNIKLKCNSPHFRKGNKSSRTLTPEQSDFLTERRIAYYKRRESWRHKIDGKKYYMLYNPKGTLGQAINYHRWLWEQVYGEIPKGYVVRFKDDNSFNVTISNLYLEKKGAHIKRAVAALTPEERKIRNEYKKMSRDINTHKKLNLPVPSAILERKAYLERKHPVISRREKFISLLKKDLMI